MLRNSLPRAEMSGAIPVARRGATAGLTCHLRTGCTVRTCAHASEDAGRPVRAKMRTVIEPLLRRIPGGDEACWTLFA